MRNRLFPLIAPAAILAGALCGGSVASAAPGGDAAVTLLHLGVVGTVRETPDLLCAVLDGTAASPDPATAQRRLDADMKRATDMAGATKGIDRTVAGYAVDQGGPDPKTGRSVWTAHQSLQLRSADAASLLELVGRLQAAGLTVDSLQWVLSDQHRTDAEQRATAQALSLLRARANAAATALGLRVAGIRSVTLGEQDRPRPLPMMRMMPAAPMAPPQATRSDAEVSQSADAEIALSP